MSFSTVLFTEKGRALQAKAMAGTPLNFTKIAMGSGSLGGQSQIALTNLIEPKVILNISSISRDSNYATVKGIFNNADITTGFYWRELGVFAMDPDAGEILYCYGNAGALAEYIPPQTSEILEKVVSLSAIVGNASNVTATINQSIVYASRDEVEELKRFQKAGGTETEITLTGISFEDGFAKTFIAKFDSTNTEKTINGKPWYKPGTNIAPTTKVGRAVTVWFDAAGDCFFYKASAVGNITADHVLADMEFGSEVAEGVGNIPIAPQYPDNFTAKDFQVYGDKDWANGKHNIFMKPPRGYFDNTKWVGFNEPNLHPDNLKKGVRVGSAGAYIEGAYTGDGQFLNFPLSIIGTNDALPAFGDTVGHICIKNSNLASQITSIKILEALNAGDPNGTLTFVVSDLAGYRDFAISQQKKLTSGGNTMTLSVSDSSGGVTPGNSYWRVSDNPAGGSARLWLTKPMIYSKVGGVLDIETAYMWNGTSWEILCEKAKYAFTKLSNSAKALNYSDAGLLLNTNSLVTTDWLFGVSKDGRYYVTYKGVYKRDGDVFNTVTPYFSIPQTVTHTDSDVYDVCAVAISGNGQYLVVAYRKITSGNSYSLINSYYKNNGTTFEKLHITQVVVNAARYGDADAKLIINDDGSLVVLKCANSSTYPTSSLTAYFRDNDVFQRANSMPSRNISSLMYAGFYNGDLYMLIQDYSPSLYGLYKYTIDYVNKRLTSSTIKDTTDSNYFYTYSSNFYLSAGKLWWLHAIGSGTALQIKCFNIATGVLSTGNIPLTPISSPLVAGIGVTLNGTQVIMCIRVNSNVEYKYYMASVSVDESSQTITLNMVGNPIGVGLNQQLNGEILVTPY